MSYYGDSNRIMFTLSTLCIIEHVVELLRFGLYYTITKILAKECDTSAWLRFLGPQSQIIASIHVGLAYNDVTIGAVMSIYEVCCHSSHCPPPNGYGAQTRLP